MLWYPNGRGEGGLGMAASPTSIAALEAYLDKRFSIFEDRTCLLFCQIVIGINNRIVKETNIQTKYVRELMDRVYALEHGNEQLPQFGDLSAAFRYHKAETESPQEHPLAVVHRRVHHKAITAA
jgi:hypothetical protein